MDCVVAVVIAILALVVHLAGSFFEGKTRVCPGVCSG